VRLFRVRQHRDRMWRRRNMMGGQTAGGWCVVCWSGRSRSRGCDCGDGRSWGRVWSCWPWSVPSCIWTDRQTGTDDKNNAVSRRTSPRLLLSNLIYGPPPPAKKKLTRTMGLRISSTLRVKAKASPSSENHRPVRQLNAAAKSFRVNFS